MQTVPTSEKPLGQELHEMLLPMQLEQGGVHCWQMSSPVAVFPLTEPL